MVLGLKMVLSVSILTFFLDAYLFLFLSLIMMFLGVLHSTEEWGCSCLVSLIDVSKESYFFVF